MLPYKTLTLRYLRALASLMPGAYSTSCWPTTLWFSRALASSDARCLLDLLLVGLIPHTALASHLSLKALGFTT